MHFETDGLVLREAQYKDSDKILTILTREQGKLTVSARGALRKGCRFAASTQLLSYSRISLFSNRGYFQMDDASLTEAWLPLRKDLERVTLAAYAAELCETLAPENVECAELLELLLLTLARLSYHTSAPEIVKTAFELRLMALSGYAPDLERCVCCANERPDDPYLHLTAGGLHCADCKPHMPPGISMPLPAGVLAAMRFVLNKESSRIYSFSLDASELTCMAQASEAFLTAQLERGFTTLDFYKQINPRS